MDTRKVDITLQGKQFTIRTAEDQEIIDEIVDFSNAKLGEIAQAGPMSRHNVALMALLAVVEELAKERETLGALKERIRMKSALILDMLESGTTNDDGDNPPAGGITYSDVQDEKRGSNKAIAE
ncbi:MAG: cell division protein ZapA [Deltaproteobacteria bacterium]|nr:cell division protein ZapA [Deltaproteobacteria bacterium]